MQTADSISNLLQKAFATLPVSQRFGGDIKLGEFADLLLPVLSIVATPERDKIISVQSLSAGRTVTGANTEIIHTTDRVPPGEIHRYVSVDLNGSIGTSNGVLERLSALNEDATLNTPTIISRRGLIANNTISLLSVTDVDFNNNINSGYFAQVLPFLDVYPGGWLRITHSLLAVGDNSTIFLLRLRLHGPLDAFNENASDSLSFAEA